MAQINNTPPLLGYLLAAALKVSGGGEWGTRALFFPLDLASAWGLLALAARFLKRPLWPTLMILAGPAWTLNLHRVMAERAMAAFAMPALWLLVVGVDDDDARAFWASAACAALALLSKYNALFLLPPALFYAWRRGVAPARLAAWAAAALSGLALALLWTRAAGGSTAGSAWAVSLQASRGLWSAPTHKLRALLAFTGGLTFYSASWPRGCRPSRRALLILGACCALLYGPWFDLAPLVSSIDRTTGFLLAWGACAAAWPLLSSQRGPGAALWAPWILAVAALQLAYWSVLARFVVFLTAPLTLWLWERLESEEAWRPEIRGGLGVLAAAALSLLLGTVDRSHAAAQKSAAESSARDLPRGARLWCAAHWGLQEYSLQAGGRELDADRGGWGEVRPGDRVLTARVNANVLTPRSPLRADVRVIRVDSAIPLRLMSGWSGEGGFYSSVMGFLPWSLSTEPVDEITVVEAL